MGKLPENLKRIKIAPKIYLKLPESSGVYIFFKDKSPIYIGKAINLKRRVSSYFDLKLGVKTAKMVSEASDLSFIKVSSELEALLLEAKLIRLYMPKYNVEAKDDKNPLYIQITKEQLPRILTARKVSQKDENIAFYGPFPSSRNVTAVLKMIRRIFPYSDHKLGTRGCLYSHIGLCNPCPSEINKIKNEKEKAKLMQIYKSNIRNIKSILDGKIGKLFKDLTKKMEMASKGERFEEAGELRDQIKRLEYITRPQMPTEFYLENPNLFEDIRAKELAELKICLKKAGVNLAVLRRIECYDVAHLTGTFATASMVTFLKGEPEKEFYRHFRIRQKKGKSDIDSMEEVIKRRIKHFKDWGKPDLIVVDGGIQQVNIFRTELKNKKIALTVVGIAKNPDRLVVGDNKIKLVGNSLHLLSRLRDEAHRFARKYHHKLVSKQFSSD